MDLSILTLHNFLRLFHIRCGSGILNQPLQRLEVEVLVLVSRKLGAVDNTADNTLAHMSLSNRIGAVIKVLSQLFNELAGVYSLRRSNIIRQLDEIRDNRPTEERDAFDTHLLTAIAHEVRVTPFRTEIVSPSLSCL